MNNALLMRQQKLSEAEAGATTLRGEKKTLEDNVASLESAKSKLEQQVTELEGRKKELEQSEFDLKVWQSNADLQR